MAFRIKTNDTSPKLAVTLTNSSGNAINLSGCTARFHMKAYGQSGLKVQSSATITDAPNGVVEYAWSGTDTDTAGTYYGEVEITYGDGSVETFPNNGYFTVIIKEDLD